jgi:hypothetical protein
MRFDATEPRSVVSPAHVIGMTGVAFRQTAGTGLCVLGLVLGLAACGSVTPTDDGGRAGSGGPVSTGPETGGVGGGGLGPGGSGGVATGGRGGSPGNPGSGGSLLGLGGIGVPPLMP